jgi:hypothetical protein
MTEPEFGGTVPTMRIAFLCTLHGSFVYFDAVANVLRHGGGVPRNAALLTDDGTSWLAWRDGETWRRLDGLTAAGHVGLGSAGAAPLHLHIRGLADGLIAPDANGLCLSAEPDGSVTLLRSVQGPAESFLPVEEADCAFLDELRAGQWITTDGRVVAGANGVRLAPPFRSLVGDLNVPVRAVLAARARRTPDAWSVLYDAWKVEQLSAFRPLVYISACGKPEAVGSLAVALQALQEFGGYQGEILIFSDRTQDEIGTAIPPGLHRQCRLVTAPALDALDQAAIKFRICDMPDLADYRPLLSLDVGVVCNRPLEPLLFALAQSQRLCVPLEHELMGEHNHYGASLFTADETAQRRSPRGFSTCVLGIPSMAVAQRSFPLILDSLYGLARSLGTRQPMPGYDQPVANYVLHKTNAADFELLSPQVITPVRPERPVTEIPRLGFAHFGGPAAGGDPNVPALRAYLDHLRRTL